MTDFTTPPELTRLALHNYLTKTCGDFGERAHKLERLIERKPMRLSKVEQFEILSYQLDNTLQMISVLRMFSTHLEALHGGELEEEP